MNAMVKLNPDKSIVEAIREGLKARGGYCPCRRESTPDTKCMGAGADVLVAGSAVFGKGDIETAVENLRAAVKGLV